MFRRKHLYEAITNTGLRVYTIQAVDHVQARRKMDRAMNRSDTQFPHSAYNLWVEGGRQVRRLK